MSTDNKVKAFSDDFWKYASNTKGVIAIEDAFINWSNNSNMTIKEFTQVWAKIHDDISKKFGLKKADISFSRPDEIMEFINSMKDTENLEQDMSSVIDDKSPVPTPTSDMAELDLNTSDENVSSPELPLENELESGLGENEEKPDLNLTKSLLL